MHSLGELCGDIHLGHFKKINWIELFQRKNGNAEFNEGDIELVDYLHRSTTERHK